MKNLKKVKNLIPGTVGTTAGAAAMTIMNTMPVYAAESTGTSTGIPVIDNGMNIIKVTAIGIVSIIGVVLLAKGGMSMGTAISQRDSSGIATAAAEIGGGLFMGGIGVIIGLMGF